MSVHIAATANTCEPVDSRQGPSPVQQDTRTRQVIGGEHAVLGVVRLDDHGIHGIHGVTQVVRLPTPHGQFLVAEHRVVNLHVGTNLVQRIESSSPNPAMDE